MIDVIEVDGLKLHSHLAVAKTVTAERFPALILCHGFPPEPRSSGSFGETYPQLADRLNADTGWTVLTFEFRGTGQSEGDFSMAGWRSDLRAACEALLTEDGVDEVWIAGFGTGGSLGICAAAEDDRVKGVAAFAAPAHFEHWVKNPKACLERARASKAIRSRDFPTDFGEWAGALGDVRPIDVVEKVAPRPVLIVHGADDEVVSIAEARSLAEAAGSSAELRILGGAGHDLRHDPRAVAMLMGWLERQSSG